MQSEVQGRPSHRGTGLVFPCFNEALDGSVGLLLHQGAQLLLLIGIEDGLASGMSLGGEVRLIAVQANVTLHSW